MMKNHANKPAHITKGDVFDDLGFSRSEASALRVKATLFDAILREVENQGYSQNELVEILDEYQPSVSNLLRGKISKVSLEKLLAYSDRLNLKTTLKIQAPAAAHRRSRIAPGTQAHSRRYQARVPRTHRTTAGRI